MVSCDNKKGVKTLFNASSSFTEETTMYMKPAKALTKLLFPEALAPYIAFALSNCV